MTTKLLMPYVDYSDESSTVSMYVLPAITDGDITTLHNAIVGVTVDGNQQAVLKVETGKDGTNTGHATDPLAQRENKWLVQFIDPTDNGKKGSFEIPCADLTLCANNTDKMDISVGAGLALKAAVESLVTSAAGNAVSVQAIKFVGRKL